MINDDLESAFWVLEKPSKQRITLAILWNLCLNPQIPLFLRTLSCVDEQKAKSPLYSTYCPCLSVSSSPWILLVIYPKFSGMPPLGF